MAVSRLLALPCVAFGVALWLSWSWTPAPTAHYAASHTVPSTLRVRGLPSLSAVPSSRLRSRSHTPNGDLIPAAPPPATPSSSGSLLLLAPFAAAVGLLALALPRLLQSAGLDDTGPHPERAPMAAALLLSCALTTAPADALAAPGPTPAAVSSANASQDDWQSRLEGFRTLPKAPSPPGPSASSSLFPGLPTFKLPTFPDLPTLPRPPTLPSLPSLPTLPSLPSLPSLPAPPSFPTFRAASFDFPRLPNSPLDAAIKEISVTLRGLAPPNVNIDKWAASVDPSKLWAQLDPRSLIPSLSEALKTDPEAVIDAAVARLAEWRPPTLSPPGSRPGFLDPAVNTPVLWALSWAALVSALVAASTPSEATYGDDTLPLRYDLDRIRAYYRRRPAERAQRTFEVLGRLAHWALSCYGDQLTGSVRDNEPLRARELVTITGDLGPAFIKIAQAASMRPDLLSPAYITALQQLQDRVPPFPDDLAAQTVVQALPAGMSLSTLFKYGRAAITQPVAAASIGQVYKVELQDGRLVALKVQRPDLLPMVSLDLFIVQDLFERLGRTRTFPQLADTFNGLNSVISAWASRFLQELDYRQEAANQIRFNESMARSNFLQNSLRVPKVYTEFTSQFTLMTEWIPGERLSDMDASSPAGRKAIATLLNAYLVQLLETGFLHADPHLGNFLRTPEGRLVVLDFGLMTEITENQRYGILDYIAHLSARDFDATLRDLVALEFIPEDVEEDPLKRAIVAPLLGEVLTELQKGGGAQRINIEQVGAQIERLGREYPLSIPAYFGLIIRTFSSLEGLGLRSDVDYAIVKECFPYMAYRLLTDDSPRIRVVLRTFLYGNTESRLRLDRVEEVIQGFRAFSALAPATATPGAAGPGLDPAARDAVRLLLAPNGNYVQDLVVDELARLVDCGSRSFLLALLGRLKGALADPPPFAAASGPLMALRRADPILPFVTQLLDRNMALVDLTPEDRDSLEVADRLLALLRPFLAVPTAAATPSPATAQSLLATFQQFAPLALDVLPGLQRMTFRGIQKLIARATLRLATAPAAL